MRVPVWIAGLVLAVASMTGGCDCDRYDPDAPVPNLGGNEEFCDCASFNGYEVPQQCWEECPD